MNSNHLGGKSAAEEKFIVASANSALATTGALFSSGVYNLADGQIGLVSAEYGQTTAKGSFIPAADATVAKNRFIQIAQGTQWSANPQDVGHDPSKPAVILSPILDGNALINFGGIASSVGSVASFLVNDFGTLSDNTVYSMNLRAEGPRHDRLYGVSDAQMLPIAFETPNYTALSLTSDADHFAQNMAKKVNLNSRRFGVNNPMFFTGNFPAFAVGINKTGAGSGTAISGLSAGSSIDVFVHNGTTYSITLSAEEYAALAAVEAASGYSAAEVETIDLSSAGAAAKLTDILIIAVDMDKALVRDEQFTQGVRTKLRVGLDSGFNTAGTGTVTTMTYPQDKIGTGARFSLQERRKALMGGYTQQYLESPGGYLQSPSFIVDSDTQYYNSFMIENHQQSFLNYSHLENHLKKVNILTPSTSNATNATLLASLIAVLQVWLASAPNLGYIQKADSSDWFI